MVKKIYFQSIFFSFFFIKEAFAAESGGMPQLNPEFWVSQIFWLILTFGIMYLVLSKLILPKISNNLESRKSQILENIEAAEKQREDSDAKLKEYDEIIYKSKLEANGIFNQARKKAIKDNRFWVYTDFDRNKGTIRKRCIENLENKHYVAGLMDLPDGLDWRSPDELKEKEMYKRFQDFLQGRGPLPILKDIFKSTRQLGDKEKYDLQENIENSITSHWIYIHRDRLYDFIKEWV